MYRQLEKKLVKQQYLLHMSSQYGELQPTNSWDRFVSLGHPKKFQQVLHLGVITALTSLTGSHPNFAQCLAKISCAGTLYTFSAAVAPWRNFARWKFTLCPSLAFSYIRSVTEWHCSSGHQPDFAVWYKEWNYRTFAEGATYIRLGGHHVGHQPTFYLFY